MTLKELCVNLNHRHWILFAFRENPDRDFPLSSPSEYTATIKNVKTEETRTQTADDIDVLCARLLAVSLGKQ